MKTETDGQSGYILLCQSAATSKANGLSHYIMLCNLPIMTSEADTPPVPSVLIGGHRI